MQAALEKKRELPDWYLNEPAIRPDEQWYVEAFNDLTTCRSVGMSLGRIPWRDILTYAEFHEIDDDLFPIFKTTMTAMDTTYLKFHAKKLKAPPPAAKPRGDGTLAVGEKAVERPGEVAPRRNYGRRR